MPTDMRRYPTEGRQVHPQSDSGVKETTVALMNKQEIDVNGASFAYRDNGRGEPMVLPFSEAVRVGDTIYLSGQIGNRPGTLDLFQAVSPPRPSR
jgi:enamine deaminase RidA (YjgF/YER057c/UK114 family)